MRESERLFHEKGITNRTICVKGIYDALCVKLSKVIQILLVMNEIIHELFQTETRQLRDFVD